MRRRERKNRFFSDALKKKENSLSFLIRFESTVRFQKVLDAIVKVFKGEDVVQMLCKSYKKKMLTGFILTC